jgi:hypothetical protein
MLKRILFVPGRYSERVLDESGKLSWELSAASKRRANVAAKIFDPIWHDQIIFSGGWPGFECWSESDIPPLGNREASLQARPLKQRLAEVEGWSDARIAERVKIFESSSNSIGDVRVVAEAGGFSGVDEVNLVTGALHGLRFASIIAKAVQQPVAVERIRMRDIYGRPATEFHDAESAPVAVVSELGAVALTRRVLAHVGPGNLEQLADAEAQFINLAAQGTLSVGRAIAFGSNSEK